MRGDMRPRSTLTSRITVSIRAPHFHAGRRRVASSADSCHDVSIRAPHFHAGRPDACRHAVAQSKSVSIRAPHFHAGRLRRTGAVGSRRRCFNPRPAFSCGATDTLASGSPTGTSFNPRPAFSCGATAIVFEVDRHGVESFNPRPAFSCGATAARPSWQWTPRFQSAPRIFMRGDRYRRTGFCAVLVGFNPRPAFSCGATPSTVPPGLSISKFQSAPRIFMVSVRFWPCVRSVSSRR